MHAMCGTAVPSVLYCRLTLRYNMCYTDVGYDATRCFVLRPGMVLRRSLLREILEAASTGLAALEAKVHPRP
eukprot:588318-Rhodomonas_salina.2